MILFVLSTLWVCLSPNDIIQQQPRIFYLMVGTAFANVTVSLPAVDSLRSVWGVSAGFYCLTLNLTFYTLTLYTLSIPSP